MTITRRQKLQFYYFVKYWMYQVQDITNGNFGYRQITMTINRKYQKQYNPKRIRRLMTRLGLKSHIRRSNGYSTKTSYVNIEKNILNREFSAEKPNEKWVTDITHMKYGFGKKAYLSAIKDLYDGSIVAYQVGRYNDNPLVICDGYHKSSYRSKP